jgi:hypothetical protein
MTEPIRILPVVANGKVGKTQPLTSIATSMKAIAAINGTYFNPYDAGDLQPLGAIMQNGRFLHVKGSAVLMGITTANDLIFGETKDLKIKGIRNEGKDWTDNWYAWTINHSPTSKGEIVIFTPDYRTDRLAFANFTFITITNGLVTAKTKGTATVPKNGFVIAYDTVANNQHYIDRFQLGEKVSYAVTMPAHFNDVVHLISCGPKLLTAGNLAVDVSGFKEAKITTNRGKRSFIGKTADGRILFGTVNSATMTELATILKKLGMYEAMALDGGASSGLFYGGKVLSSAGRALSNVIVVTKK